MTRKIHHNDSEYENNYNQTSPRNYTLLFPSSYLTTSFSQTSRTNCQHHMTTHATSTTWKVIEADIKFCLISFGDEHGKEARRPVCMSWANYVIDSY